MAEFAEIRDAILQEAVAKGTSILDAAPVPERIRRRWKRQLQEPLLLRGTSLVNHFKLGADPEFVILNGDGRIHPASSLGLHTGAAFGADLNGRLCELRVAPHRSAFMVVASTLGTLRWFQSKMGLAQPELTFTATPFVGTEGLGGHIHFGRKRGHLQRREVIALNILSKILTEDLPLFSLVGVRNRREQTAYGNSSDAIRPQTHGYEYRILPSWLESPFIAFATLTLAKLVVFKPEMAEILRGPGRATRAGLQRFLGYFQTRDADAARLLRILTRHPWGPLGGDFAPRWGLPGIERQTVTYVPDVIEASPVDQEDLMNYLETGTAIPARVGAVTWSPSKLPRGYTLLMRDQRTTGIKGLGEILQGLCTLHMNPLYVGAETSRRGTLLFPRDVYDRLSMKNKWSRIVKMMPPSGMIEISCDVRQIRIPPYLRETNEAVREMRKFLLSGFFPICHIKNATAEFAAKWERKAQDEVIFREES